MEIREELFKINSEVGVLLENSYDDSPEFEMLSLDKITGIVEMFTIYMRDGHDKLMRDINYITTEIINRYRLKQVYDLLITMIERKEDISYYERIIDVYLTKINKIRKNRNKPYINTLIRHKIYSFTTYMNDIRRGYYPHIIDEPIKHIVRAFISKGYNVVYCCSGHSDTDFCSPYIHITDPDKNVIDYIETCINNKVGIDLIKCDKNYTAIDIDNEFYSIGLSSTDVCANMYKSRHRYINNYRHYEKFINRMTYVVDMISYRGSIRRKKWKVKSYERVMGKFICEHTV